MQRFKLILGVIGQNVGRSDLGIQVSTRGVYKATITRWTRGYTWRMPRVEVYRACLKYLLLIPKHGVDFRRSGSNIMPRQELLN